MRQTSTIGKKIILHSKGIALAIILTSIAAQSPALAKDQTRFSGNVSYYGKGFDGRKTASGEKFDMNGMTCAHRTLPFGTKLLIEHPKTGKSVIVTVNDRGPFHGKRILDLARGAASKLGILIGGVAYVDVTVIGSKTEKPDSDSKSYIGEPIGFIPEQMPEQIASDETQLDSWI